MRVHASAVLLVCFATAALGKVDQECRSRCAAQGYVTDFCTEACTHDPEKGTSPAFGGAVEPERPAEAPKAPPVERRPPPPTAVLERVHPAEEGLREDVRRLKAENAALKKQLAVTRQALDELRRKGR